MNSPNAGGCPVPSDTSTPSAPLLVDRREAGRLLGVSPGTIDNLRLAGELPSVKLRGRRLFDVADLRRFIEARKGVAP
jgi:excisionase family DNA binding protein